MTLPPNYRDGALARRVATAIAARAAPDRSYHIMEFCGGHTHVISAFGLSSLLPPQVSLVHGPGCPVCVLPIGRLDQAIAIARHPEVILCTFGDMMRVPASDRGSLLQAKAQGADIRMVYGSMDALALARANPERQVVFFAIGFETTTPPTAAAVLTAAREGLRNFSVFCNHVLTPVAIEAIFASEAAKRGELRVDGVIGPGHVTTITGIAPYQAFAAAHHCPVVISGFEPLDVLQSTLMLIDQLNGQRAEVENQYARSARPEGNRTAQAMMQQVFTLRESFDWRGLGEIPRSALRLADAFATFDAERRFPTEYHRVADHPACSCPDILRGVKKPTDCRVFGTACTPESPIGACMVSPEGACAAYYQARGRSRGVARAAAR
jgi:hydrogenase expression/formation protein HypD